MNARSFVLPGLLGFAGLLACGSTVNAQTQADKVRVMSYNIQWFSEDANPERLENLRTILRETKPDVVAFQEVQSRKAMLQLFPASEWTLAIGDDPKSAQEVGVAVRKPFKLTRSALVFTAPELDYAFPNDRDVMRAEIESASGQKFVVYSTHHKSRRGGRMQTDGQREAATRLLAAYLAAKPEERAIVMGDFNDAPDDRSVNILETGDLRATGGAFKVDKPLMVNLTEPLYRKDYVTIDLARKWLGEPLDPIVEGAFAENERLRGKEYRFPQDVKVTQTMFDQILVSANLADFVVPGSTKIYSGNAALRGTTGRTSRDDSTGIVTYTVKGSQASDHLPVYADIRF